jgi:hypothetical protein
MNTNFAPMATLVAVLVFGEATLLASTVDSEKIDRGTQTSPVNLDTPPLFQSEEQLRQLKEKLM